MKQIKAAAVICSLGFALIACGASKSPASTTTTSTTAPGATTTIFPSTTLPTSTTIQEALVNVPASPGGENTAFCKAMRDGLASQILLQLSATDTPEQVRAQVEGGREGLSEQLPGAPIEIRNQVALALGFYQRLENLLGPLEYHLDRVRTIEDVQKAIYTSAELSAFARLDEFNRTVCNGVTTPAVTAP